MTLVKTLNRILSTESAGINFQIHLKSIIMMPVWFRSEMVVLDDAYSDDPAPCANMEIRGWIPCQIKFPSINNNV